MRFVFYTNSVSPHQLPLARELVRRFGEDSYCYIYTHQLTMERRTLGWHVEDVPWRLYEKDNREKCRELLLSCDVLMSSVRDFSLFEQRRARGLKTLYTSERWFKPISLFSSPISMNLPGWLRLLHPCYLRYAKRIVRLLAQDSQFAYYPIGVWAKRDMELVCRLFGRQVGRYREKMHLWGYFVEPTRTPKFLKEHSERLQIRVLWVGRILNLKRVDTIIRAVAELPNTFLDVYGFGEDEIELRQYTTELFNRKHQTSRIFFHPQVPVGKVRELMAAHDVYVFSSNALDGWGAVVNEALEEGMRVVGTYEAGASATILPRTNLFHAGDWRALRKILSEDIPKVEFGQWKVSVAADHIEKIVGKV